MMIDCPRSLKELTDFFGAHRVPDRARHEAESARNRAVVCAAVASVWAIQCGSGRVVHAPLWFVVLVGLASPIAALAFRRFVLSKPTKGIFFQYAFLIFDPVLVTLLLIEDPWTFAFLNPLLLLIVIRIGICYGLRTMYLAWGATLAGAALLLSSPFWRDETEMMSALLLMLLFVPLFFSSLIRGIHEVREIEQERARYSAVHDVVLARSAFLAKVSHELRSPLQGILSALDVLSMRHGSADDPDDEIIARIRRSSALLNTQLRDLLTLAKGEAGHLELRPEPFDACSLVENVASEAAELAAEKGLDLVVEVPSPSMFVVADGSRVDQILTNLVVNSIRYTEVGQVRVALLAYEQDKGQIRFVVSDTGPGIPASMLPALLTPDRSASGSARRGEGSGIGLAIVATLVRHLGGTVDVTSHIGAGTTFTLAIPAEFESPSSHVDQLGSPTGRLLIVDVGEDVPDALTSVVDELGFECDRARSVPVAANRLAATLYVAVLVNLEMPFEGGKELVVEARRGGGLNRNTRFIGMSAREVTDADKRPFDGWLSKPVDYAALRQILLGPGQTTRPSQPGLWADEG